MKKFSIFLFGHFSVKWPFLNIYKVKIQSLPLEKSQADRIGTCPKKCFFDQILVKSAHQSVFI